MASEPNWSKGRTQYNIMYKENKLTDVGSNYVRSFWNTKPGILQQSNFNIFRILICLNYYK